MPEASSENLSEAVVTAASASAGEAARAIDFAPESLESKKERLRNYMRRLLHIRVPVQVTLAAQRKSVQEIIELGPGSIVKFEKTCDQPLEINVGGRTIAEGEVVKVGDKFGVRISGLVK